MSQANRLWGAPRIHEELLKLGMEVAPSTVAKYLRRHRKPPSQTWRTFLSNHVQQMASIDFFTVPNATFRILFVFVVLSHARRRVMHFHERNTRLRSGLCSKFAKRSRGTRPRDICARSRCDLWQRLRCHHQGHEDGGRSDRAAHSMAESVRGTAGGFHPPRAVEKPEQGGS
jgi:hypothetical protein